MLWVASACRNAGLAELQSFEITAAPGRESSAPRVRLTSPFAELAAVQLGLGEDVFGQVLRLSPSGSRFRVEMQWETSLAIHDEGAHLDLLKWRHYTSPWTELPTEGSGGFRIPTLSDRERRRFPETGLDEIRAAVAAAGGGRWLAVVPPTMVFGDAMRAGVSAVRFRVSARQASGRPVLRVEVGVPMGT